MSKVANLDAVRAAKGKAKSARKREPETTPKETPEFPIVALGVRGKTRFYLDRNQQLIELDAREHGRLDLVGLFGGGDDAEQLLRDLWPRTGKAGETTGWRPESAAMALIGLCSEKGIFDPLNRVRGRGAWRNDDGALVIHTGESILEYAPDLSPMGTRNEAEPGLVGRFVYPAGEPAGVPSSIPAMGGDDGPAFKVLEMLKTWHWRRGDLDAMLLLGWIGAALIGGALRWRPMAWVTGGSGAGKSTLQELLDLLFDSGLIKSADASPAGIWQEVRHQTLPVLMDEQESEEDNRRVTGLIKLARLAASGGVLLRGGADHKGTSFTARNCFLFSSILIPPLQQQDRNRMAILELNPLRKGTPAPKLDPVKTRAIGAQLRRRMIDGWWRLETTLESYRAALEQSGQNARGADQFGTLLACADLLLWDDPEESDLSSYVDMIRDDVGAEAASDERDEERCIAHLLSFAYDNPRLGGRLMMAEWVRQAAELTELASPLDEPERRDKAKAANRVLATFGLRVARLSELDKAAGPENGQEWVLAVVHYHDGLATIFRGTHWAGRSGTKGVWVQALSRLPGARSGPQVKPVWMGGLTMRAVLLPVSMVLPPE